jgi:PmbA protein
MGEGVVEERSFQPLRGRQVGRETARRAAIAAEGIAPETDETTLVFKPWAALSFLRALISALSGEAVQLGQSMFVGKQGQTVASPLVNVIDDGRLAGRPGSSPVDGEGVPRQTTPLIAEGVLHAHYHDLRSARKAGVASTGNSHRAGYRSPPRQAPSNAYLAAGETPPGRLISSVDYGIEVVSFTDTGGVSGITGDFSIAASGRRIRHGHLSESLDPFTICGNLHDLLARITGVGSDLTWFGNLGSPTVRVEGLKVVGGK